MDQQVCRSIDGQIDVQMIMMIRIDENYGDMIYDDDDDDDDENGDNNNNDDDRYNHHHLSSIISSYFG